MPRRLMLALLVIVISGSLRAARAGAQGAGRQVSGTVVELGSGAPVAHAQVQVRGTAVGTEVDDRGQFSLRVPAGDIVLVVRRIGYRPAEFPVGAGQATARVELERTAANLDQIVVTGQATGVSRINAPTSVSIVSAEDMTRAPTQTIEHALQGKVSGIQISQRTGAPGGGNVVRIRGSSTIIGESNPLYIVDGVIVSDARVSNGQNFVTKAAGGIGSVTQDQPVNRIADLDPNEIESVEMLKGPSAAAIYGSKASNGVIVITTKRGTAGRPRFNVTTSVGTSELAYRNGQRRFLTSADAVTAFGASAAQYYDSTRVLDYETLAYGRRPVNSELVMTLTGGSADTRYFISGMKRQELGIVRRTFADKYSVRANLDQRLSDRADLQLGASAIRTVNDRGLFGNENNGSTVGDALTNTPSFIDLRQRADGTWPVNPFFPSNPLQTIELVKNDEAVWRGLVSARLQWRLMDSGRHALRFVGYGGADLTSQRDEVYSPPTVQYEPNDGLPGTASASEVKNTQTNLNLNLVHVWRGNGLTATSQLGSQFEKVGSSALRVASQNLVGGLQVATSGATAISAEDSRTLVNDFGLFAQTEWLVGTRLMLTAGARADRSSNNADVARFHLFPKASASYRFPDPRPGLLDELKVRVAYGETGNRPSYGDKFASLGTTVVGGVNGYVPGGQRPLNNLHPERQAEIEGGVDAVMFSSRLVIDLTGFRRNVTDMLITRAPAPSSGYTSEIANGADMRMWGVETGVTATPITRAEFAWTSRLTFGLNRATVTRMDGPSFDLGSAGGLQARIEVGKPPTQIIGLDTLPQSPRVSSTVVLGDGNPQWNGGRANEFRRGGLSLYVLVDRQQGGLVESRTFRRYITARNLRDYDVMQSDGRKLGDVLFSGVTVVSRIAAQDASYTKLREVSIAYDIPSRLMRSAPMGAQRASVRVSGRNLAWWTSFRGGDPEAENFGGGAPVAPVAVQRNRELGAYPSSRSYWLSLHVEF